MTLDYFLYKLVKAGEKMRELQKEYYGEFTELKSEKEFDEILEGVKEFLKDKLKINT